MRTAALIAVLLALSACSLEDDRMPIEMIAPDDLGGVTDVYTAGDPVIRNIIEANEP